MIFQTEDMQVHILESNKGIEAGIFQSHRNKNTSMLFRNLKQFLVF